ncbi:beta-1 adrenergic receptor-like [Periplaneta americana]|uniref:beta-1 adrenergic receptor-like n=1 Tax=Periplaneta americana TaxID=6978 RepID=UPI0037E70581
MDDVQSTVLLLCEVLLAIICLTGTLANATVLLVFYRRPALRTLSNRFVINLVCTNLVSTCVLLPLLVLVEPLGEGVAAGVCCASVLAVLLIALDQYCAVVDPLRYHARISKARSAGLILAAWSLSCVLGALHGACEWFAPPSFRAAFAAVFFALAFFLPFVAILWIYVCIYAAAHSNSKRTRKTGSGSGPTPAEERSAMSSLKYRISNASMFRYREETRAARISALVIVMALVCWLPYASVLGLRVLTAVPRYVHCVGVTLLVSASVVSPCLFAYRNPRIRREARRLLCFSRRDGERRNRRAPQHRKLLPTSFSQTVLTDPGQRRISFLSSCVNAREPVPIPEGALAVDTCRSSFSSGGSTQGTSSTMEAD